MGPRPISAFNKFTPKVDWKDGITQLNLVDLNTEEAQQALKKVISFDILQYYMLYRGNRSLGVINAIMIEQVVMSKTLHLLMQETTAQRCAEYKSAIRHPPHISGEQFSKVKYVCSMIEFYESKCDALHTPEQSYGSVLFRSDLSSECAHRRFLTAGLQFYVLGVNIGKAGHTAESSKPSLTQRAKGNTFNIFVAEPKSSDEKMDNQEKGEGRIRDELFIRNCKTRAPKLCAVTADGSVRIPVSFRFRSPERMVRYLGELIATQNYGGKTFVPYVVDPDLKAVLTLLRVVRGVPPYEGSVATVRDPDGEAFYVPRPDYQAIVKDRSLETMAIVSDVLNGAVSKKAFPQPTTFTLAPSP